MALTAAQKKAAAAAKAKAAAEAAAAEEVEEVEDEAPAAVAFGVSDIVALIKTKLKKDTTTRELRTLLRKMARDGRLDREIVAGNRARWEWSGPTDPEVLAVLKAFKAGELDADKKEKLDALKARKAEQRAAKAAEAEAEADDEELVDDEDE
jgi:hypothetical protein